MDQPFLEEDDAYKALLPKFFAMVKAEALKPYWFFWKSTLFDNSPAKNSEWENILKSVDDFFCGNEVIQACAKDFLAYLINLNDQKTLVAADVSRTPKNGYILYKLGDKVFKTEKEKLPFFQKHWGKIAVTSALASAATFAAWRNRHSFSSMIKSRSK
jgi:hypothetical protein